MVIYSFVGISGPLKTWLLIEKQKGVNERYKCYASFKGIAK